MLATRTARLMPHLAMHGNPVFRWASFEMAKVAQQALDRPASPSTTSTSSCRTRPTCASSTRWRASMKLPERVAIARDIADQGNTSAASIPLALDRMLESGEAKSGDTALLIAFGAGLAYAAQVVTVP